MNQEFAAAEDRHTVCRHQTAHLIHVGGQNIVERFVAGEQPHDIVFEAPEMQALPSPGLRPWP